MRIQSSDLSAKHRPPEEKLDPLFVTRVLSKCDVVTGRDKPAMAELIPCPLAIVSSAPTLA